MLASTMFYKYVFKFGHQMILWNVNIWQRYACVSEYGRKKNIHRFGLIYRYRKLCFRNITKRNKYMNGVLEGQLVWRRIGLTQYTQFMLIVWPYTNLVPYWLLINAPCLSPILSLHHSFPLSLFVDELFGLVDDGLRVKATHFLWVVFFKLVMKSKNLSEIDKMLDV